MKESDEYYTPEYIINAARTVLGRIDLDPASCERAQSVVNANTYYSKDDDGLCKTWRGRVWLNPPFSDPKPFVIKLIDEYEAGNVQSAIILTNNSTETRWGQALIARYPVCFVGAKEGRGSRIAFWKENPAEPEKGNRYSQMIFYLGNHPDRFAQIFSEHGLIMVPYLLTGTQCPICERRFTPKRRDALYCGQACNQKAKRQRQKQ